MNQLHVSLSFSLHFRTIPGRSVYIVGDVPEFGSWLPSNAFPLTWSPQNQWVGSLQVPIQGNSFNLSYKLIEASNDFSYVRWEETSNRKLSLDDLESDILLVLGEVWEYPQLTKRLVSIPLNLKKDRDCQKLVSEEKDVRKLYNELLFSHVLGSLEMDRHHYSNIFKDRPVSSSENSKKVKRLTHEIKILQNYLPLEFTNAIFVKYDEQRMDVMKALIMGAEGTPYANGAFLFDIYFDENYPQCPPKVTLMTTGGGKIRFNPNLYNNGYVCLSLLGTWSGDAGEKWREDVSNLLQVLISLQSIVMSEGVLYNEPAYAGGRSWKSYENMDNGYTNIVKYANLKYAMIEQIKNPPKGFEEIVKLHFYLKKEEIMKECMGWLNEAERIKNDPTVGVDYGGLVSSHNYDAALMLAKDRGVFYNVLSEEVENLKKTLEKIEL